MGDAVSSTLTWEPAHRKKNDLPTALKWKLQKRYFGVVSDRQMEYSDIPYLEGLRDADVEGAQELIDAIEKHEVVIVTETF